MPQKSKIHGGCKFRNNVRESYYSFSCKKKAKSNKQKRIYIRQCVREGERGGGAEKGTEEDKRYWEKE